MVEALIHERVAKMMDRMGVKEGEVIQHSLMTKSIERAQVIYIFGNGQKNFVFYFASENRVLGYMSRVVFLVKSTFDVP